MAEEAGRPFIYLQSATTKRQGESKEDRARLIAIKENIKEGYGNTELVGLDGFVFHSSTKIHCEQCSTRRDRNGEVHYYHSAITPVILRPGLPYVLPLPPEFIVPQDGHEKQDCERATIKRWLVTHTTGLKAWSRTYLADDLYANQPCWGKIEDMRANRNRITYHYYQALTLWRILLPQGQNLSINAKLVGNVTPEKPYLSDDTRIFQNVFHEFSKIIDKMTC